jgi:hypothetical protein
VIFGDAMDHPARAIRTTSRKGRWVSASSHSSKFH